MDNKFSISDVVFTIILIIVLLLGIGLTVVNRVERGAIDITMDNYEKVLRIHSDYTMISNYSTSCVITFEPLSGYIVKNVNITISVEGKDIDRTEVTVSFSTSHTKKYNYTLEVPNKNYLEINGILSGSTVEITVTAVTGQYEYVGGDEI